VVFEATFFCAIYQPPSPPKGGTSPLLGEDGFTAWHKTNIAPIFCFSHASLFALAKGEVPCRRRGDGDLSTPQSGI